MKYNCDVFALYDNSEFGLGVILRDDMGALIAYKWLQLLGLPMVKESEALALLGAMTWVHLTGYYMKKFEIYCKEVVDASKHDMPNDTEFELILRRCHILFCFEPSFKVIHIRRNANEVVHAIVRWSLYVQTLAMELKCLIWLVVHLISFCNLVDH